MTSDQKKIDQPAATSATSRQSQKQEPQTLHVGRELLDTTWRMTVPVVIFAGLGIAGDIACKTKPWLTILGAFIGFYFASLLIKRQIGRGGNAA